MNPVRNRGRNIGNVMTEIIISFNRIGYGVFLTSASYF